jgi:cell division septation protein DedD
MIPGDKKTADGLAGDLASSLGIELPEAQRLLDGFSKAMAGELLSAKCISLGVAGAFCNTYIPSGKKTDAAGIVYTPPRNTLVFQEQPSGTDDAIRLAVSRMALSEEEAGRFSNAFLSLFGDLVKRKQPFGLNGLGSFGIENGKYTFFPDRTVEELLNREYLNLDKVVLPLHDDTGTTTAGKKPVAFVLTLLVLVAGISAAVWYYLQPEIPLLTSASEEAAKHNGPKIAVRVSRSETVQPESVQPPATAAIKTEELKESAAADSVVLAKGEFTIVLATFRKEETAINESRRLRAGGISAFIWPAMVNGAKYYRLATGKFRTGSAAAGELKEMPGNLARGACIQQAIKGVVIHGEQQL